MFQQKHNFVELWDFHFSKCINIKCHELLCVICLVSYYIIVFSISLNQSARSSVCWVIFAIFVAALVLLHHTFFSILRNWCRTHIIFDRLWRMSSSIAVGSATCSRDIYISLSTLADSMGLPLESADWESLGLSWETKVGLWGPGAVFCWYYNTL